MGIDILKKRRVRPWSQTTGYDRGRAEGWNEHIDAMMNISDAMLKKVLDKVREQPIQPWAKDLPEPGKPKPPVPTRTP